MNRLHEKGMIENPVSKAKSVVFTADGLRRSRELFEAMFTKQLGAVDHCGQRSFLTRA